MNDLFGDLFRLFEPLGPGDNPTAAAPKQPYQQAYDISRECRQLALRMGGLS